MIRKRRALVLVPLLLLGLLLAGAVAFVNDLAMLVLRHVVAQQVGADLVAEHATVMRDIPNYHATPQDAPRAASAARVRVLAYTHMIPPLPAALLEGPFLEGVADIYDGPTYILRDGMLLTLARHAAPVAR